MGWVGNCFALFPLVAMRVREKNLTQDILGVVAQFTARRSNETDCPDGLAA